MNVYIPKLLLVALVVIVTSVPAALASALIVATVGTLLNIEPPLRGSPNGMLLTVVGMFIGGTIWGWLTREWFE